MIQILQSLTIQAATSSTSGDGSPSSGVSRSTVKQRFKSVLFNCIVYLFIYCNTIFMMIYMYYCITPGLDHSTCNSTNFTKGRFNGMCLIWSCENPLNCRLPRFCYLLIDHSSNDLGTWLSPNIYLFHLLYCVLTKLHSPHYIWWNVKTTGLSLTMGDLLISIWSTLQKISTVC